MSFQLNKSRRKESKRKDGKTFQLVNDETIYISTETQPVLLSCGRHPAWLSRRGIEYLTCWLSLVLSLQLVKFRWVRQWHHHAFLHFHHPVHLGGLLRKSRLMLCDVACCPRLAGVEAPRVPGSDPKDTSAVATVVPNTMCMRNPIHEPGVRPGVKQIQVDCSLYFYSSCLFIHLFFHIIT